MGDWRSSIRVGQTWIVTVGRVAPQKDPALFLDILEALRSVGQVEATWVGDGAADACNELDAAGVSVTGWLAAAGVPDAISNHTVYLHTAGWEASVPIAQPKGMDRVRAIGRKLRAA